MDQPKPETEGKHRVQSAARTVEILKCVAEGPVTGISAKEISLRLNLPRQVVYHIAHTLIETDMLRKVSGSTYGLGIAVSALATGFRRQLSSLVMSSQMAEQVSAETGEAAYIVGWVDDEIVVLVSAKGRASVRAADINLGTAGNAHARASGKLLLSMIPDSDLNDYIDHHPLTQLTPNTITHRKTLLDELAKIRTSGISVDNEEFSTGLTCIAVPVGSIPSTFALGLSAPTDRAASNFQRYVSALRTAALGRQPR